MKLSLFIILVFFSYLLGSLCSAIVVCRLFRLPDPRETGSKNPGATNVLRLGGKLPAIIVLLFDVLKGAIPVLLARLLGIDGIALGILVGLAVIGHIFPIFFSFQGGKGVATAMGGIIALSPGVGLSVVITWGIVAYFTRYSSLASIIALTAAPFYNYFFGHTHHVMPLVVITLIVLLKHSPNIMRLINGNETKIGNRIAS